MLSETHSETSSYNYGTGAGEKYLLKVVAKYADRYNLYFGTPQKMERKINILKD